MAGGKQKQSFAVGIDFGNTCLRVAIQTSKDSPPEVVVNDLGGRHTANAVATAQGGNFLAGDAALHGHEKNIDGTVFGLKRLFGKEFSDEGISEDLAAAEFYYRLTQWEEGQDGLVRWQKGGLEVSKLVEILLGKIKGVVEDYVGSEAGECVMSVPTHWNQEMCSLLRTAASSIGLSITRLIKEPCAALLAQNLDVPSKQDESLVVVDFGGSTTDVSVYQKSLKTTGQLQQVASSGDGLLGAYCFDRILFNLCEMDLRSKARKSTASSSLPKNFKIASDPKASLKLLHACSEAKRALTSNGLANRVAATVRIDVEGLVGEYDYSYGLSYNEFEAAVEKEGKLEDLVGLVEEVVAEAGDLKKVCKVVFIGGGLNIPLSGKILKKWFVEKCGKNVEFINGGDEAVVTGCALQAGMLMFSGDAKALEDLPCELGEREDDISRDVLMLEESVGLLSADQKFHMLFAQGTALPASKTLSIVPGAKQVQLAAQSQGKHSVIGKFKVEEAASNLTFTVSKAGEFAVMEAA